MVNRRDISGSKSSSYEEISDWSYYPPLWYGVANAVLSLGLLALCIVVMIAMRCQEEYNKSVSNKIMFRIAVFDVIQLVAHLTSGISLILTIDMPNTLNTIVGSMMAGAWITSNCHGILLAVHRLFCVSFPNAEAKIFSGKPMKVITVISISIFPLYTAIQFSPWTRFTFTRNEFSWDYDYDLPLSYIFLGIDHYSIIIFLMFAAVSYSIIFRRVFTNSLNRMRDAKLTLQILLYCIYCAITFCTWELIEPYVGPRPIIWFWFNLLWIFWNGAQSIICLTFHSSIRRSVLQFFKMSTQTTKTAIFKRNESLVATSSIRVIPLSS